MRFGRATLVFGSLGAVWAIQLAAMLRVGCYPHDDGLQWLGLPLIAPAMGIMGCILAWHGGHPSRSLLERILVPLLVVPSTGLVLGVLAGLLWWPEPTAMASATLYGLGFGTAALAFLAPVILSMQRATRPRSLMDRADRYTTWSFAACAGCASAIVTALPWKEFPGCDVDPVQANGAAIVSAVVCLAFAVLQWLHVRKSRRLLTTSPQTVDIGLHDDAIEKALPNAPVYRRTTVPPVAVYASYAQAIMDRRVRLAVACAILALALAGTTLGLHLRLDDVG